MSDIDERVRRRAHEIWEREGRPDGRHDEHWAQAEAEIRAEDGGSTGGAEPAGRKPAKGTRAAAEDLSAVAAGRADAAPKPESKAKGKPAVSPGGASRGKTARAARKDATPEPRKNAPPQ